MIDTIDFSSMTQSFIGYGFLIVALMFWFVWPKAKAKPYSQKVSWPGYVLHYFHPLAWVLFGLAAFIVTRAPIVAGILAGLGVIAYVIFIIIFIKA